MYQNITLQIFPHLSIAQEPITHFAIKEFAPSPPRKDFVPLLSLVADKNDL